MSAERRIAAYFDLADRGLKSADTLFRNGQFEDAAYFAQQIVERVARALLTKAGIPFGTSHNLGQMASALPEGHTFKSRINEFDGLSSAATRYRYPTSSGWLPDVPDVDELRKTLDDLIVLVGEAKAYVYGPGPAD
jgi:HEPN domain-containing protein